MSAVPYPEDEYVLALGKLAYSVSYLEWAVLGDLPHIPGLPPLLALNKLAGQTTGGIAQRLSAPGVLDAVGDGPVQDWLKACAKHLDDTAKARNSILHARPATIGGQQRLQRWDPSRGEVFAVELERIEELITDIDVRLRDLSQRRLI